MSDLPTHAAQLYGEQLLTLLRTYLAASKTQPMAVASSPITLNGTDCRLAVMSEELFAVLVVAAEEANTVARAAAPEPSAEMVAAEQEMGAAAMADWAAWDKQHPNGKSFQYDTK